MKLKAAIATLCVLVALPLTAAAEKPIEFKMANIAPANSGWEKIARDLTKEIEAKSGNRIKVIWYFGAVQGDEIDVVRKINFGQLDGGVFTLVGLGKMAKEIKILELPFLLRNYGEADYIMSKSLPTWQKIFEKRGYMLAGLSEVGFVHIYSGIPLNTEADFAKVKMWSWAGDAMMEYMFKSFGFSNITSLPIAEVLPGLQTGRVDAFAGTHFGTLAMQWYPYAKYVTDWPVAYTPTGAVISKRAYNKLPKDLQKVLLEGIKDIIPKATLPVRQKTKESFDAMTKRGMKVIKADPAFWKRMQEKAKPIYNNFMGEYYSKELFNEITGLLKQYRAGH